jgi:hypothetical protein
MLLQRCHVHTGCKDHAHLPGRRVHPSPRSSQAVQNGTKQSRPNTRNPVEIARSLELPLRGTGWINHLEKQTSKAAFTKLRGETCHVHAEIQMLLYQNSDAMSPDEQGSASSVHPYIGCSKRCCLLCWLFIRIHGAFHV